MKLNHLLTGLVSITLLAALAGCGGGGGDATGKVDAAAKVDYPTKQVELLVPFSAGGGTDAVARAFADAAKTHFAKPFGVVNKTGGGGAVGMAEGAKAKADGYKVTLITADVTILPHLGLASFKPEDFKPITMINQDPSAVTVRTDAPWNSLEEFIEYAKANPEKVRVANSGTGGIWHLAAAAFEDKSGVKLRHIPYEGAAPAVTALLGGHVEAVMVSPAEVSAHVTSGKLKMLGVMSDERLEHMKDVPTLKEQGVDLSVSTWRGLGVPKDTPQEIVSVLKDAAAETVKEQSFQSVLDKMNLGKAYLDDAAFQEKITSDSAMFKDLIDKSGLKK
ncbi:Bug family tripartite tricarboxylate transporter substrate binding protein [Brevibacillus sp. B_LB10_24]|uniref:Bug family tripartite tricarboxylate transporter substrate binding protein n=1 Tax=Brevibacillus sp. B_LB10_24 TaxID=3380645 RepID=UPI0038B6DD09